MKYELGKTFIAEKTSDKFLELTFHYEDESWEGAIPLKLRYQGYEVELNEVKKSIEQYITQLNPINYKTWKTNADSKWKNKSTQTYKVFDALCTNKWECRVCGPVPKVNPQAASRLRDIKKKGFVISTKRKYCNKLCKQTTIHDILIPLEIQVSQANTELRKPISETLGNRIYKVLKGTEVVFNQKRTKRELIIDHKFPSQRWKVQESDNKDSMSDSEIINKFQLLSNQTNLLKSRECDKCLFEGKRGVFMGIQWYYKGDEKWNGMSVDDEDGCIGCPWYDVKKWKAELMKKLSK